MKLENLKELKRKEDLKLQVNGKKKHTKPYKAFILNLPFWF